MALVWSVWKYPIWVETFERPHEKTRSSTTDSDFDKPWEGPHWWVLGKEFSGNRGFLFPDVSTSSRQVHFITIPSHCLSSMIDMAKGYWHPFMDHLPNQSSKDTLSLTQLVHRALSGSTEVLSRQFPIYKRQLTSSARLHEFCAGRESPWRMHPSCFLLFGLH